MIAVLKNGVSEEECDAALNAQGENNTGDPQTEPPETEENINETQAETPDTEVTE